MSNEPAPQAVPFYLSKTLIVNAVIAIAAFIPSVRDTIAAYPEVTVQVIAVAGIILRLVTSGRVVLN